MSTFAELEAALPKLGTHDREIATSLLNNARQWFNAFTEKQERFARVLINRAREPLAVVANDPTLLEQLQKMIPPRSSVLLYDLRLKFNKERTCLWVLSRDKSRFYAVATPGRGVDLKHDGIWAKKEVLQPLEEFMRAPLETVIKAGIVTGRCCFCDAELSTERSRAVGYGPDCAKRRALPW